METEKKKKIIPCPVSEIWQKSKYVVFSQLNWNPYVKITHFTFLWHFNINDVWFTLRLLYVHLIAQFTERLLNYFQAMNLLQVELVGKTISHGQKNKNKLQCSLTSRLAVFSCLARITACSHPTNLTELACFVLSIWGGYSASWLGIWDQCFVSASPWFQLCTFKNIVWCTDE